MRIIIAGSREFDDYELLKIEVLRLIKEMRDEGYIFKKRDIEIISGTARGADKLGERFAKEFKIKCTRMAADWDKYKKRAGYLRNAQMSAYAKEDKVGILVAFWNGSRGTKHMIDLANKDGLKVKVIKF